MKFCIVFRKEVGTVTTEMWCSIDFNNTYMICVWSLPKLVFQESYGRSTPFSFWYLLNKSVFLTFLQFKLEIIFWVLMHLNPCVFGRKNHG